MPLGKGYLHFSILAVATLFANTSDFTAAYSSFTEANAIGLGNFVEGAAVLAEGLAIPVDIATTIVSIIVVSFAATTLDTAVRLMRYIIAELGTEYNVPALTKTHVATTVAVVSSAALVLIPEGPTGFGSGGYLIWPLFGTSNQLLAGISLLLISLWLKRLGRNYVITLIPMIFLMFMTLYALGQQVILEWSWWGNDSNTLLFVLGAINFVFALWIALTAISAMRGKFDQPMDRD
ncbi:hypothetical protein GCM10027286_29570 [Virgibacillus ainsalahensis]